MGAVADTLQAQIASLAAQGHADRHIARVLGITRHAARAGIVEAQFANGHVLAPDPPKGAPASAWAQRITLAWRKSAESIFEAGRLLIAAKAALPHGDWEAMCERDLPFKLRTAQRIMAIAADERLSKATHVSHLPQSWGTLYELTKLDDQQFGARIEDGTIRPEMERKDISGVIKSQKRDHKERELGEKQAALPDERFGVIVADPEWRFEPWSRATGMDRAADNHYPTTATATLFDRDVPSIAAPDSALFLWATVPMLNQCLAVMDAWGFGYKSHVVWIKDAAGTGYWFRNTHELLLVGTRGNIPAPAPGTQWRSAIEAPRGEHSAKPEIFLQMIEQYFPTLPKIELNRRGPARPGWKCWGLEAQTEEGEPHGNDLRTDQADPR